MHEFTPLTWAKTTWCEQPLELLLPAGIGLIAGYATIPFLALRSGHPFLLWLCLGVLCVSALQSLSFLLRLWRDARDRVRTLLSREAAAGLLLPGIASVVLYALIAPSERLGLFFAFVSLPHYFFVLYLLKHHALVAGEAPSGALNLSPRIVSSLTSVKALGRAVLARVRVRALPLP